MRATCLLLCLALATATGYIFPKEYTADIQSLIVDPLEYVNQIPVRTKEFFTRTREQDESAERVYPERKQKQRKVKQPRYQPYEEQRDPEYRSQLDQIVRDHDSTSTEHRDTEWINNYAMPVYGDVQKVLNARLFRAQRPMQPAYGDAITWRGVRIADSPTNAVQKEDIEKIFGEAYKTMNHVGMENKKIFHQALEMAAKNVDDDSFLNATQLLNKYQYPVETYNIKTEDGYFLTLFRIPPKDQTLVQRPVVFLMHGLLGSADDWLVMGPGKSLAYMLSDAGYDVWLGNARGSKYSRRHVSKHPAQADFWQFGNDEIALQDLPTMIDYALKTSNQQKMYYVGYSSGTTALFALLAARPEYNDKIIMMYALSPMVYMSYVRSPLLRMIAPTSPLYERMHMQLGHGQFEPSRELVATVGGAMCETVIGCKHVCSNVHFVMSGINVENLEVERLPVIMSHLSTGASTRQMKHFAQGVASQEFTKYDFGAVINEKVYGSRTAPKYDMTKVTTPVALYYSEEDWLANPRDVERLAKELPNVKDSYKVPEPHFSHMDFQFAKIAPEMVYNRLIQSIKTQQVPAQQSNVY